MKELVNVSEEGGNDSMEQLWEKARSDPLSLDMSASSSKTPTRVGKRNVVSPTSTEKKRSSSRQRRGTFDSDTYTQ